MSTNTGVPPARVMLSAEAKKVNEGTGIGLTVVRRLAEEHGGIVRVKTEIGKGTIFIVDFPYVTE